MQKPLIDEQTIKAYNDAIEKFCDALTEALEHIAERFEQFADYIVEIANTITRACDKVGDISAQYLESIKAIDKLEKERFRWSRIYPHKIKPLLLDKRSKIHRCRNAI